MKYIDVVIFEIMNKYICLNTTNEPNIINIGVLESPTPRKAPASI